MVDEQLVRWASKAMGGTHVTFDKSVGAWYIEAAGVRAFAVLTRVGRYIIGEKARMIDCVLRRGKYVTSDERPCTDCETKSIMERRIANLKNRKLL